MESVVLDEMVFLKANGGGTVVENSCRGMGRNIPFMIKVARQTGLHVVAGTGMSISKIHLLA